MKMKTLVFFLTIIAIVAIGFHYSTTFDTFWHLRTGQIMLNDRSILTTDPFTFQFEGKEWLYPSLNWLSEIQMSSIFNQFGFAGLNVWVIVIAALGMAFIYKSMSGSHFLKLIISLCATFVSLVYWGARPHMYSFLFTTIFIWVLENYRLKRANRLWLLPIIMVLWVNSHSGFIIGILILLIYIFGNTVKNIKEYIILGSGTFKENVKMFFRKTFQLKFTNDYFVLALSLIVICINPLGVRAYSFISQTLSMEVLQDYITEWQSPNFHETAFLFFLVFFFLIIASIVISPRKVQLTEFLLILIFGIMSFVSVRNIYLFAITTTPILTHLLAPVFDAFLKRIISSEKNRNLPSKITSSLNIILLILAIFAAFLQISPYLDEQNNLDFVAEQNPVEAANHLAIFSSHYKILNSYNFGGYLSWALPSQKVFIDGRTELYGDEFLQDWLTMVKVESGWEEILDKWDFNIVMLEPYWQLTKVLPYEGWEILHEDDQAIILIKSH